MGKALKSSQPCAVQPSRWPKVAYPILLLLVFLAAGYLAFTGLDHTLFWDDEAMIAIHAKNYLATGTWTAWTGRNLMAYQNGIALDNDLQTKEPKVQLWLAVAAFKLLGASTWAGRLPFVLVGLAGLGVFALILRLEFKDHPALQLYALALLAFSPVFLLNIRQCRYYAPCLTFALLSYYFSRRCLLAKARWDFLGLGLAAALLFHSHYLVGGAFLAALLVVQGLCYRHQCARAQWFRLAAAGAVFALGTVPFLLTHRDWARGEALYAAGEPWYLRKPTLLWWHVRDLNLMTCLPWSVALVLVWLMVRHRRDELVRRVLWP